VGHFIAAGTAVVFGVLLLFGFRFDAEGPFMFNVVGAASGAVLASTVSIQVLGFYGMWRNYGSLAAAAAFAFGLIASSLFAFASLLAPLAVSQRCDWGWCFTVIESWG